MSAPVLDPRPATPAHEWATETTEAIGADPYSGSGTITPGPDIPGAYPATRQHSNAEGVSLLDNAKQYLPAQADVNQALKSASDTANHAMQSAAEAAKQYLPAGVMGYVVGSNTSNGQHAAASANDSFHVPSMPSTEITGAHSSEKVGGVGALPGTIMESGVAKLPDERQLDEKDSTLAGLTAGTQQTASQGVAAVKQTVQPMNPSSTSANTTSLPSMETTGAQPGERVNGIGALPGNRSETNVAKLPSDNRLPLPGNRSETGVPRLADERPAPPKQAQSLPRAAPELMVQHGKADGAARINESAAHGTQTNAQNSRDKQIGQDKKVRDESSPYFNREERKEDKKFPERQNLNLQPRVHPLGPEGATLGRGGLVHVGPEGVDAAEQTYERRDEKVTDADPSRMSENNDDEYHPAKIHPPPPGAAVDDQTQDPASRLNGHGNKMADGLHNGHGDVGGKEEKHKPTMMEKLKGEAKIITGKLSGKHQKVEEGVAMKAGESRGEFGSAVSEL